MFAPLASSTPSASRFPSGETRGTSYAPGGSFQLFDDARPVAEREITQRDDAEIGPGTYTSEPVLETRSGQLLSGRRPIV